jgi:hypothetical protein
MKSLTLSLAILASSVALAMVSLDAGADQLLQTKQLNVRNAAEVKKVFGIAAADGGRQAIEISCSPADSDWCAKDFVTACDNAKGGMSTGPDGGVTCSLPQYN